jgi:TonB family protein
MTRVCDSLTRFIHTAAFLPVMNSLSARELLDTPLASAPEHGHGRSLAAFMRRAPVEHAAPGTKLFGGLVALGVQVLFVAGIAYGTMRELIPQLDTVTVVNILDETPVVEELPPPPPPRLETPAIQMQAPLVTITEPEPPKAAPTAIITDTPAPPPAHVGDGERERLIVEFQRALQRHLIRHMRYPPAARARKEEGIVYVRVAMSRAGHVLSAKIQDASDFPELNEEGLAVIARAQPLPLPPDAVPGDPVDLIIPVTFSLRTRGGHRRDN